jgi:transcriptional regulator of acetoin/glycerol metabolism
MMTDQEILDVRDLPEQVRKRVSVAAEDADIAITMAEMERRHARRVVEFTSGNKVQAANILGIARNTLYRILGDSEETSAGEP